MMTRKLAFQLLLGILLALVACQQIPSASNTPTSIIVMEVTTLPPVITQASDTPFVASPVTSTPKPSPTQRSSSTPTPFSIFAQAGNLSDKGTLWIHMKDSAFYTLVDLESGNISSVNVHNECGLEPLPHSSYLLCKSENHFYLDDLLNDGILDLPIQQPNWFGTSPNGQFLFYGYNGNESGYWDIYAFDLT